MNDVQLYKKNDFESHFGDLKEDVLYTYEDKYCFCAGSYNGYSQWRNVLAPFVGYEQDISDYYEKYPYSFGVWKNYTEGDFYELLNFSDCEGCIGKEYSKKLYQDFVKNKDDFYEYFKEEPYYIKKYNDFMLAFQFASENGCVEFH